MTYQPTKTEPLPRLQLFVSDLSATGVVRNAVAIANHAATNGYQVRILACTANGVLRDEILPLVEVVELVPQASARGPRKATLKRALVAYRKHSRSWRPDVLFSAGNHGHLISTIAWLGLPGKKILRISNDLDHSGEKMSRMARWYRSMKLRLLTALADRLILVSRELVRHPALSADVASGKAVVIANGVDIDAVRHGASVPCPHPAMRGSGVPIVLAIGRHVKQKNFGTLLQAFAHVRRSMPAKLVIIGEGDPELVDALRHQADELGIGDSVELLPATPNPFSFMAAAQVLVLPSLWEGSSNVLLEAMACGLPIVASNSAGDAAHVLEDGRYGLLCNPHDVAGLAEAVLRQVGDNPVHPGDRVETFSRHATLQAYLQLFATSGMPVPFSRYGKAQGRHLPTVR